MDCASAAADPNRLLNEANALFGSGRLQEAAEIYRKLLKNFPAKPFVLNRLASIEMSAGRPALAAALARKSLELAPDQPVALLHLGVALHRDGKFNEAVAAFDRVLAAEPAHAKAHFHRGNALAELHDFDGAFASYSHAIAAEPGYAEAHCNLGTLLQTRARSSEALACYDRAVAAKPGFAEAVSNRAMLLKHLGQFEQALAAFDVALSLQPAFAEAQLGKAELLLLLGRYQEGWDLYEWRWKTRFRRSDRPAVTSYPVWSGEQSPAGKSVLIRPEVGLGDFIMFARYVPMLRTLGARPVISAPAALGSLLRTLGPDVTVVEEGQPLPHVDLQIAIMSLPRAFKTTLASVPARVPYLSAPERLQLPKNPGRVRVGLVWSGQANRNIDGNPLRNRSIPLRLLEPVTRIDCEFHSLQKEIREDDAAALASMPSVVQHQGELRDFSDTAALVAQMDLVISIDTSVAHLAGALARPLWVMLPYATDYRWMAEGDSTPWYPTAALFRQTVPSDWEGVVSAVQAGLERFVASAGERKGKYGQAA